MEIMLDYGTDGLPLDLPDDCTVILPEDVPPLSDLPGALQRALQEPVAGPPLAELARQAAARAAGAAPAAPLRVAISVCDSTRPHPRREVLAAFLSQLEAGGLGPEASRPGPEASRPGLEVTVIVAAGTHRADPPEIIRDMLGEEVLQRCQVHIHDCRDPAEQVALGTVSPPGDAGDIPVFLDRRWVEADLRLSTGLVEPHLFAGFSGGPKLVSPGLASLETVLALHNGRRVGHPNATWGILQGNPAHDAIRAVAETCPPHFTLEVVLDSAKRVTHVFAGAPWYAHAKACEVARHTTMRQVDRRFPLVITTSGGYPLDQNLYQAVKGVSAAERIVSDGGTIILAAECRYGLPDPAMYTGLLRPDEDIRTANARILATDEVLPDQWQVQVQARIQARARVLVKASGLSASDLAVARLEPIDDISAFVRAARGADPTLPIAVLPHGPYCVPYLATDWDLQQAGWDEAAGAAGLGGLA
jgi:nickel-dependent lactate racemase